MAEEKVINPEYNIPYYIFEELMNYIEATAKSGKDPIMWDNIKSLLGLAVINERLTREQADNLIAKYCREN